MRYVVSTLSSTANVRPRSSLVLVNNPSQASKGTNYALQHSISPFNRPICSVDDNLCQCGVYRAGSCTGVVPAGGIVTHRLPTRTEHGTLCAKWFRQDTLIRLVEVRDGHMCRTRTSLQCVRAPHLGRHYFCNAIIMRCGVFQLLRTNAILALLF